MATKCWPNPDGNYGMCRVETERYKALLKARATDAKPDMVFTAAHEVRIRPSGIGPSIYVHFDGDAEKIYIGHDEHF